ncbi:hypothetical protein PCANC_17469 [Puccinia coronata f. sp. avenae]|uniref:Uncharacterized protein n=1 Tax=Puccinia coronata f. sp. avenae TaxID=200324 RepID=A0A2N5SMA8_9BASI|nr:hypothetical protein PCANC_17469 [Puccinia coronata f. sp. avenae]
MVRPLAGSKQGVQTPARPPPHAARRPHAYKRVPTGIRVPVGTLIRLPLGTLIRVPSGTFIRVPRGSRKPLNWRGLREPGRTGVPAVHACLEGMQGLHALRTGVHGQHACPTGPHAKPDVLTPFVGVRTACGMQGRACGGLHA